MIAAPLAPTLPPRGRAAGAVATVLVHAALLLAWTVAQRPPPAAPDGAARAFMWIRLPPPPVLAAPPRPEAQAPRAIPRLAAMPAQGMPAPTAPVAAAPGDIAAPPTPEQAAPLPAPAQPPSGLLQRALRDAGAVDRALRKENNPVIVAPPDSPQLRLHRGIEAAADAVPNKWYQAPRTDVLVNDTGDGARRTRVKGAFGTYCITERAPTTGIDMIEKHGKIRLTSCPTHEQPATRQEWRTARD